jgi:hypothetical protein
VGVRDAELSSIREMKPEDEEEALDSSTRRYDVAVGVRALESDA